MNDGLRVKLGINDESMSVWNSMSKLGKKGQTTITSRLLGVSLADSFLFLFFLVVFLVPRSFCFFA
jgi:hypothetical protein